MKDLFLLLGFFAGALIYLYPTISDTWNFYRNQRLIADYDTSVENLSDKKYRKIMKAAREYNKQHKINRILDVFDDDNDYVLTHPYDTLLNPGENDIMGYLSIPKIDQELAIYHGAGKTALEKGVGHIEGTSLPIGGKNTHAVLSAHRGLPGAKLFTDLDRMKIGDRFYITVLNKKLAYEVDQIVTVLPYEQEELAIEKGEDLVTLVTCTPYAVNTHRLLVRGHRVPYAEEEPENLMERITETTGYTRIIRMAAIITFFVFVLVFWIASQRKKRRKRRKKKEDNSRTGKEPVTGSTDSGREPEDNTDGREAEGEE